MASSAYQLIARSQWNSPSRVRGRVVLVFAAVIMVPFLVVAALLFSRAAGERAAIETQARSTAAALSFGFDQEVAAVNYLLNGLSKSPAVLTEDPRAVYEQFKATPVPAGSYLILSDLERQLVNTLRPFGASLPEHTDFPNYQEQLDRIRDRRWAVSGRMGSLVKGGTVVALSLRLDGQDGEMTGFITTILSQPRLAAILASQPVPADWMKGLFDRKDQPITVDWNGRTIPDVPAPKALATRLADVAPFASIEGTVDGVDDRGAPVLFVYRRSGATNWTTVVGVPRAFLNAPFWAVIQLVTGPAALLLFAGGVAAFFTVRQVEKPLRTMSDLVVGAQKQLDALSDQLLALQEEERQRIARELHDSTAQHLVAASLSLASLRAGILDLSQRSRTMAEAEGLIGEALRELRIFTYLLHPPNLARDGLQATLQEFARGFAGRTGLFASIRIPEELDKIPEDLQRAILRVVQEALTNVHRHANASQVSVVAAIRSGRLIVRIHDNGCGIPRENRVSGGVRLGVGLAGMRARLEQFDGELRIRAGRSGTIVVAAVPLRQVSRRSPPEQHLCPARVVEATNEDGQVLS